MMKRQQAERAIKDFFHAYLEQRNAEQTASYLHDAVQWVGTGKNEVVRSKKEAVEALKAELMADPMPYAITFKELCVQQAGETGAIVLCMIKVRRNGAGQTIELELRVTATCTES